MRGRIPPRGRAAGARPRAGPSRPAQSAAPSRLPLPPSLPCAAPGGRRPGRCPSGRGRRSRGAAARPRRPWPALGAPRRRPASRSRGRSSLRSAGVPRPRGPAARAAKREARQVGLSSALPLSPEARRRPREGRPAPLRPAACGGSALPPWTATPARGGYPLARLRARSIPGARCAKPGRRSVGSRSGPPHPSAGGVSAPRCGGVGAPGRPLIARAALLPVLRRIRRSSDSEADTELGSRKKGSGCLRRSGTRPDVRARGIIGCRPAVAGGRLPHRRPQPTQGGRPERRLDVL